MARAKIGIGFHEVNARRSDFAFVSAAAQVELGADGKCKRIAIGVGAATDFPMRLDSAEQQLTGSALDAEGGERRGARRRWPISSRSTTCTPPPTIAAASRSVSPRAPSPMRCADAQGKQDAMRIELNVNGAPHELDVEPRTTLLDCLRDQLGLKGAHAGCEHGVCGACTVLFDGVAVRSCLMFAVQAGARPSPPSKASRPAPANCRRSRTRSAKPTACNAAIARRP